MVGRGLEPLQDGTVDASVDGGSGVGSRPSGPVFDDDPRYDRVTGRT